MCTVTIFSKNKTDFILTSNRDEAPHRISRDPDFYDVEGTKLLFPKDELAGGTWIGVSEKNRLICVLNGGFKYHKRKAHYRASRGVVAKDFMIADDITRTIQNYYLEDIEPFTMVIADWNNTLRFFELVWDGRNKYLNELPLEPKVWSSSTLYSEDMKAKRQAWFKNFKSENDLNASTILKFHKTAGQGNLDYGVVMDRGFVKTTSITQVEKKGDLVEMRYENLQKNVVSKQLFKLPQTINE